MKLARTASVVLGLALVWNAPALAQQAGKVGVVMAYPASIGVLWHVSESVAVRPDVSASRQTTETTTTSMLVGGTAQTSTTTSEGWTTSAGVSALFYLGAKDDLRFYLTPRLAYVWSRSESESSPALAQLGPYESESDGVLVAGALGAQYAPHERFTLFGELGVSYTRQDGTTGFSISRTTTVTTSVGLRSGVGVVVYF